MSTKTKINHKLKWGTGQIDGSAGTSCSTNQKVSEEKQTQLIQVRAYELWEAAGRPDGDAARERFWADAEMELLTCPASDS